jgi:hypothetical protein
VSYRRVSFRKVASLRVRPVEEMGVCIVFTPENPKLYTLNWSAWLIMELCDDGRGWRSLERAYFAALEPSRSREVARVELRRGLDDLIRQGVIELVEPAQIGSGRNHLVAKRRTG